MNEPVAREQQRANHDELQQRLAQRAPRPGHRAHLFNLVVGVPRLVAAGRDVLVADLVDTVTSNGAPMIVVTILPSRISYCAGDPSAAVEHVADLTGGRLVAVDLRIRRRPSSP